MRAALSLRRRTTHSDVVSEDMIIAGVTSNLLVHEHGVQYP